MMVMEVGVRADSASGAALPDSCLILVTASGTLAFRREGGSPSVSSGPGFGS
jgi:hypothetical protein